MLSRRARDTDAGPIRVLFVGVTEQSRSAMAALEADERDLAVAYAETIARAAELLEAHPGLDAVVAEGDLPDGDGIELLELVRSRDPDLPVVLVSASTALDRAAIAAGATDVVPVEPLEATVLQARLERAIGRYRARRERRARRRVLEMQRRALGALVAAVPDALLVADESRTIDYANSAIANVLGYSPEELIGTSLPELLPDREIQQHLDTIERNLTTGERNVVRKYVEVAERQGDRGEGRLAVSIGGYTYDGRTFFVVVVRDVSQREGDRRRREFELDRLSSRVERLDRLVEQLLRVGEVLVRADTREQLERDVCRELVGSGQISFVWIGEVDDRGIHPRARAGHDRGYLDSVTGRSDDPEPAVKTSRTRTPTVIDDVDAGATQTPWRQAALARGIRSIASVPMLEGDRLYGTLTAYASAPGAFDEKDRRVLKGIADAVAYGIGALERERALIADTVVELQLELSESDDIFSRLARDTGATVELDGIVPRDDSVLLFLTATNAPRDDVTATLESDPAVIEVSHDGRDGGDRFQITVESEPLLARLVRASARLEAATADSQGTRMQVSLPVDADVKRVMESLSAAYDDVTLLSRTDRPREFADERSFLARLEDRLTDRQMEVLRTAFLSGYFEWPREQSSEEVATSLDISQPTFNHHLRIAERKLLSLLFGPEEG